MPDPTFLIIIEAWFIELMCVVVCKHNQGELNNKLFFSFFQSNLSPWTNHSWWQVEVKKKEGSWIDRLHVTTAIWWPLGVAVVSVTCMRVRWVSHTWKYTQWNIFLFEASDKSPYWTNPHHMGFRSLNFHTYFGQCPNDTCILLHIPLHVCPNYPHTGLTTATAPSGHQMAVVKWDRSVSHTHCIQSNLQILQ